MSLQKLYNQNSKIVVIWYSTSSLLGINSPNAQGYTYRQTMSAWICYVILPKWAESSTLVKRTQSSYNGIYSVACMF